MNAKHHRKPPPNQCVICNGTGKILCMGEETCNPCVGTGRDTKSNCWAQPCKTCNGRGKVSYCRNFPCKSCGGRGFH